MRSFWRKFSIFVALSCIALYSGSALATPYLENLSQDTVDVSSSSDTISFKYSYGRAYRTKYGNSVVNTRTFLLVPSAPGGRIYQDYFGRSTSGSARIKIPKGTPSGVYKVGFNVYYGSSIENTGILKKRVKIGSPFFEDALITVINDTDGDGFKSDVDCDDRDVTIRPTAADDTLDNVDNDCDGNIDEDYVAPEFNIENTVTEKCKSFGSVNGRQCRYKIEIKNDGGVYSGALEIQFVSNVKVIGLFLFEQSQPIKCVTNNEISLREYSFKNGSVKSNQIHSCTIPNVQMKSSDSKSLSMLIKMDRSSAIERDEIPTLCAVISSFDGSSQNGELAVLPSSCIDAIVD